METIHLPIGPHDTIVGNNTTKSFANLTLQAGVPNGSLGVMFAPNTGNITFCLKDSTANATYGMQVSAGDYRAIRAAQNDGSYLANMTFYIPTGTTLQVQFFG